MHDISIPEIDIPNLEQAFLEIQMPRSPYVLENLVVNTKFTEEQRYAQCVLELSIAYDNLRIAKHKAELKQIEIQELDGKDRKTELKREIKKVQLEQLNRARLGAVREFECLYFLWKKFPVKFTREQLNNAQETEYRLKLQTQALQDQNATGRVMQGNQEGLRQIGIYTFPEIDIGRKVETRYYKLR